MSLERVNKVEAVQFNVHENVQNLDTARRVHGDEAAVAVMNHEITTSN